jgi:hypothetical protein
MKRKSIIVIGIIAVLLTAVILLWEFFPVKVLKDIDSEDITSIQVISSSGNQFELTEQDNISEFVRSIQQVKFQKKDIASVPGPWYQLDFLNDTKEVVATLGIQNYHAVRYSSVFDRSLFLYSKEEMKEIGNYLEQNEAIRFPDNNRDSDFPYDDTDK